jgi:hypothetical protein
LVCEFGGHVAPIIPRAVAGRPAGLFGFGDVGLSGQNGHHFRPR